MANWIGAARTNYVRLADGITQKDVQAHLAILGVSMQFYEKDGRVGFFPDEWSDDGAFQSWLQPDLSDLGMFSAEQIERAAVALGVTPQSLRVHIEDGSDQSDDGGAAVEDLEDEIQWDWRMLMPLIAPGEVLVVKCVGHEKLRYLTGYAEAYVRDASGEVHQKSISIDDIYDVAREAFSSVAGLSVTESSY